MFAFILLVTGEGDGQIAEIARTFGVDWPQLAAQAISFGIVCAVLYKFAYRPVLAVLEERRRQIEMGLANAEKIAAELQRTEAQRQEVMAQAYAQADKTVDEARVAAARLREEQLRKAIAAAGQIMLKAREAAAADHDRMLADLKREVGRLVVQVSSTVTGKILTPEDHRRLADETVKQMAA
jgi:F-type H+-transporting ATPase subunit b